MACTRIQAIRRLTNLFIEQLLADPDYGLRIAIADVLTEANIQAVQDLNLHADMDVPPFEAVVPFEDRDMQLLASWLSSQPVGRLH
jgi:hypothetical protein